MQFKTPFIDLYEELSALLQEESSTSIKVTKDVRFEKAKAFVKDFISWGGYTIPKEGIDIQRKQDFNNIAFSVQYLACYYAENSKNAEKIGNLTAFLGLLGCTLRGQPESLQYLYHALVQEHDLVTKIAPSLLKHNPAATKIRNVDEERAFYYLFSDNSTVGIKTEEPDFLLNRKYTVDAKIYYDEDNRKSKLNDKAAHNAEFVIVYLLSSNTWQFMYKVHNEWLVWPETDNYDIDITSYDPVIKKLAETINQCKKKLNFKYKI